LKVSSLPGPLSLLRGSPEEGDIEKAAAITAYYSKGKDLRKVEVTYKRMREDHFQSLLIPPILRREIGELMINE